MRIVLDAMGSDNNPTPDVAGAVLAAREFPDTTIILVGSEQKVIHELVKHPTSGLKIEVIHAPDIITMEDKPSHVVKSKPNSSMHVGMSLVKDGKADAFVTAGNTGAALSIATLKTLHRIPNVKRPALSTIIPLGSARPILLDVGANADCKPEWLAQFAIMGAAYAEAAAGVERPRVGVLSNGEEEGKGSELTRAAADLIRQLPLNFVGNIEPREFLEGAADVVVTDGFVGNIMLKSLEAATSKLVEVLRHELTSHVLSKLGAALSRPAFRRVRSQIDPAEVGGAPLLGVNGVVIIGHGSSNPRAIKNAVGQARKAVAGELIETIRSGLEQTPANAAERAGSRE